MTAIAPPPIHLDRSTRARSTLSLLRRARRLDADGRSALADRQRWWAVALNEPLCRVFARAFGTPGVVRDLDDLTADARIGMFRAAKRFDPDRGIPFSSYARWWCRLEIVRRGLTDGPTVPVQAAVSGPPELVPVPRSLPALARDLDREIDVASIIDLGVSQLPERQREAVSLLYGLGARGGDAEPEYTVRTLAEVAGLMGVSAPAVSQLHSKALVNLRRLLRVRWGLGE